MTLEKMEQIAPMINELFNDPDVLGMYIYKSSVAEQPELHTYIPIDGVAYEHDERDFEKMYGFVGGVKVFYYDDEYTADHRQRLAEERRKGNEEETDN